MEVLDLARAGAVHVEVEKYSLDEAPEAYRRLHEGAVRGRAVVVPGDRPARWPPPTSWCPAAQRPGPARRRHRPAGADRQCAVSDG
ncbi:zinc-binding dehydrogenase [Geodermatophilus sp. URMC 62]|uniref:zinc-binding dehydrogenase n=1 Tax=Geodermatophilus sp. URMC 62 TaxID=3423414 RepID=UPI00406D417E